MKTKSIIIKIIFILAAVFCLSSCGAKSKVAEYDVGEATPTGQSIPLVEDEKISDEKVSEETVLEETVLEENVLEENVLEEKISEQKVLEEKILEEEFSEEKALKEEVSEEKPLAEPEPDSETVKMSIYGKDSFILSETEVSFEEGQTVFDILKKVTREQEIPLDFNGTGSRVYISGIDNIYEFDDGPESGWIYYVNGSYPNKSCGAYELNEGDVIEWKYTDKPDKDIF